MPFQNYLETYEFDLEDKPYKINCFEKIGMVDPFPHDQDLQSHDCKFVKPEKINGHYDIFEKVYHSERYEKQDDIFRCIYFP